MDIQLLYHFLILVDFIENFALCEVIDLLVGVVAHHFSTIKSISFLVIKMLICSENSIFADFTTVNCDPEVIDSVKFS
jgi:hypothetical protein